ncbi:glycine/sarcosine/betaine reductase component B subunit, partial [Aerococcus urinae]
MTAGKLVRFQEGIVDMSGPGAELTPFSKNINIVLVAQPVEGIETHAHEEALRLAGLKVANYLGQLGTDVQPDNVEVYETKPIFE